MSKTVGVVVPVVPGSLHHDVFIVEETFRDELMSYSIYYCWSDVLAHRDNYFHEPVRVLRGANDHLRVYRGTISPTKRGGYRIWKSKHYEEFK